MSIHTEIAQFKSLLLLHWNVEMQFGARKLESWGCHTVKKSWL